MQFLMDSNQLREIYNDLTDPQVWAEVDPSIVPPVDQSTSKYSKTPFSDLADPIFDLHRNSLRGEDRNRVLTEIANGEHSEATPNQILHQLLTPKITHLGETEDELQNTGRYQSFLTLPNPLERLSFYTEIKFDDFTEGYFQEMTSVLQYAPKNRGNSSPPTNEVFDRLEANFGNLLYPIHTDEFTLQFHISDNECVDSKEPEPTHFLHRRQNEYYMAFGCEGIRRKAITSASDFQYNLESSLRIMSAIADDKKQPMYCIRLDEV